jgi:hypothetical protein
VSCLVRYHNHKSDPDPDHTPYGDLPRPLRRQVRLLAAFLRLAEGLDSGHRNFVTGLRAFYREGQVEFELSGKGDLSQAAAAAQKRAELFEREFHSRAVFRRAEHGRQVA